VAGTAGPPGMIGLRRRATGLDVELVLLLAVAVFLFLLPMLAVVYGAFRSGPPVAPGSFTLDGVLQAVRDPSNRATLVGSLGFALSQAVISTVLGVVFAFTVARTNAPLRGLVTPVMVLILATPPLFFGLGWAMLGDPRGGGLNRLVQLLTHGQWRPIDVMSWPGLIGVAGMKATSFAYLLLIGPFLAVDRSLEEAAQVAGAGRLRTLLTVEVKLLAPSIMAVALLGFLIGLQEFEIPLILGLPAGIRVFATQIYFLAQQVQPPRFGEASALSILVIAIVLLLVQARSRLISGTSFVTVGGRSYRRDPWDLGGWRWLLTACILVFGLVALVLPLAQLVVGSLQSFLGLYTHYTLANYESLLGDESVLRALTATALIMVVGGGLATAGAVLIGRRARRGGSALGALLGWMAWLPFAVPGVVLGLGISWAWLSIPPLRPGFGTVWINLLGLMVLGIPVVSRSVESALLQVSSELEEAARIAGATARQAFARVVIPLIRPSALAGWAIAAIVMSGNLAVPILLSSLSNQPVAVLIYDMYLGGEGGRAAALLCLLLAMLAAGMALGTSGLVLARWGSAMVGREATVDTSISDDGPVVRSARTSRRATAVELEGLSKRYGNVNAIVDLDLRIEPGELVTLLGPSGCGKTTTLRCVVGLEVPDTGRVRIGEDVVFDARRGVFVPPERRETGMVFQSFALWPHLRVGDNIAYPMRVRRWSRRQRESRTRELLALVGLPGTERLRVEHLSGGQQQRVAVARALAAEPRLLVFDEPLSNLDARLRAAMRRELRRIHDDAGATSLYVTHDQVEAMAMADRVVVMKDGRVRQVGTPREVFSRPADGYVADFVGYENVIAGRVSRQAGREVAVDLDHGLRLLGRCSNDAGLSPGAAAEIAFRGSSLRLTRALDEAPNLFRGQLEEVVYLGDRVDLRMKVGAVTFTAVVGDREYDRIRALKGTEVEFHIPPEEVLVMHRWDPAGGST
jgi:iron(III) transport system permease protein